MKKIKQAFLTSRNIRVFAILLTILFGTAAVCGWYATYFLYAAGFYHADSLHSLREDKTKNLRQAYEAEILSRVISENPSKAKTNMPIGNNSNLRYAVIKSTDTEENPNTSSDNCYATNLSLDENLNNYTSHFTLNGDLQEDKPSYPAGLFSSIRYSSKITSDQFDESITLHVTNLVYNRNDGIFYYIASEEYITAKEQAFPVKSITVNASDTTPIKNHPNTKAKVTFHLNSNGKYLHDSGNFEPLDTSAFRHWDSPAFDFEYQNTRNISYTRSGLLPTINRQVTDFTINIPNIDWNSPTYATEENSNEMDSDIATLTYDSSIYYKDCTYQLYSILNTPLKDTADDLFFIQQKLVTKCYQWRYTIPLLSLLATILLIGSLLYCGFSAGERREVELQIRRRHRFSFLLCILITGSLLFYCINLLEHLADHIIFETKNTAPILYLSSFLCVLAFSFLLITLLFMNFSIRVKANILWKTFLISKSGSLYQGIRHIWKRTLAFVFRHTSLVLRGGTFLLVLSLLEMAVILLTDCETDIELILWVIYKVIEIPAIFYLLIQMNRLQKSSQKLAEGNLTHKTDTTHMLWDFKKHGENLNCISQGMEIAIHKQLKSEQFKTELITNVSHDIKTPLTSIINYVDLLKNDTSDPVQTAQYLEVLERQSHRLKKLMEDLMEASKASTGNLPVTLEDCNIEILLTQTLGEFEEKLSDAQLELIIRKSEEPTHIMADQRHLWRIFDNLMNNVCKYGQPGTRVYINEEIHEQAVSLIFRNTSKYALNISSEELMERFVRGDSSRTTEGNGLGLSIAQNLAKLMNGTLELYVDGDLFKVILTFQKV